MAGLAATLWAGLPAAAEMPSAGRSDGLPEPVTAASFAALRESSPFLRSIGLSQSIVLTGIARIEEEVIAILHDLESRESYLVTEEANFQGWQLLAVAGNPSDLESLTAQIKVAGSEVVFIRYQKVPPQPVLKGGVAIGGGGGPGGSGPASLTGAQVEEARRAAENYREGFTSDGYPRQPPPEMVAKLSRLSVPQREAINRQMLELRNRGMGMEERRGLYERMVDRTLQGGR